jgi:hypothetical protein
MEVLKAMFGAGFDLGLVLFAMAAIYLAHRALCGISTYIKFRGSMMVTCPETHEAAVVEVAARCAGIQAMWDKRSLQVSDCSRWPMPGGCHQDCLRQIEACPADLKFSTARKAS